MPYFSRIFRSKKSKKRSVQKKRVRKTKVSSASANAKEQSKPAIKKRPSINTNTSKIGISTTEFLDIETLKAQTLKCLEGCDHRRATAYDINYSVVSDSLGVGGKVKSTLSSDKVRKALSSARKSLKKEGKIGYNAKLKDWYIEGDLGTSLTEKEHRYLKHKGLGEGWLPVHDELAAVEWLHKAFSDDEFEQFCCALLVYCGVENVQVTQKRRSGADGGLDGVGMYLVDGVHVQIAFEAKRHALKSQVGSDICQKLSGAMMENNIKHGFIITTASFSKRARESVEKIRNNNNYQIELIDQKRMAEIMLYKGDAPHGFGLHRTDIGLVYMNKDILRKAVQ